MPILKETAAMEKWCPFSRVPGKDGDSGRFVVANRKFDGPAVGPCIGRDCMAWRTVADAMSDDVKGYCGAFGRPANA